MTTLSRTKGSVILKNRVLTIKHGLRLMGRGCRWWATWAAGRETERDVAVRFGGHQKLLEQRFFGKFICFLFIRCIVYVALL